MEPSEKRVEKESHPKHQRRRREDPPIEVRYSDDSKCCQQKCLRSVVDITLGLRKDVTIIHCPECDSYLQPPRTWIKAQLESKELLTYCLNILKIMNKVRLGQAEFIWTEPHSKRIKAKLRVQKEVLNGAILEQAYIVEYTVQDRMCESCSRVQANPDQWVAKVQLRQHVSHGRTFLYLEQLIFKHAAAVRAIRIEKVDQGIEFFFANRSHAVRFAKFLGRFSPTKKRPSSSFESQDFKSNKCNLKHTFSVNICPICPEDLICLPQNITVGLGNFGPLVIYTKVGDSIGLLDPYTLRHCYIDAAKYWRAPFKPLLSSRELVKYIVYDINIVPSEANVGTGRSKYTLTRAVVARVSDVGKNSKTFSVGTHLGHLLKPGDYALGYDLYGTNKNDIEFDKNKGVLEDVILIKKCYNEKHRRMCGQRRALKLKSLGMEIENLNSAKGKVDEEKMESEYEEFLRDLEKNPDLRFNISLYDNNENQPSELSSMTRGETEDAPFVLLEELVAKIDLSHEDSGDDSMTNPVKKQKKLRMMT